MKRKHKTLCFHNDGNNLLENKIIQVTGLKHFDIFELVFEVDYQVIDTQNIPHTTFSARNK